MPIGIPYSHFLGGPLCWSEDDQDMALAFQREQALICKGCGIRRDEWDQDPDAFIAVHDTCPGCQRLEEEEENVAKEKRGVKKYLVPKAVYFANRDRFEGDL